MSNIQHLGVIMDGNRRWAKEHGLPSLEGHRRGYDTMKKMGDWCLARGIKYLTVYAFSVENWKRKKGEINYLMGLFNRALTKEIPTFMKKGVRLKVIGSRQELSAKLKEAIAHAEAVTKNNDRVTLNLAINYGGRLEIVEAVKKIVKKKIKPAKITEQLITENIWTAGEPSPDLIIRTSGEQRLSGFLTWQSVYSELYFTKCHWPAFSEKDLDAALADFESRQRRFGGNNAATKKTTK